MIYRSMRRGADRAGQICVQADAVMAELRGGIERLDAVSSDVAAWSGAAVDGAREWERNLAAAAERLHYGLARLDWNVDRAAERIEEEADALEAAIRRPLARAATQMGTARLILECLCHFIAHRSPPARG
jgi:uncharacterized protein YukE